MSPKKLFARVLYIAAIVVIFWFVIAFILAPVIGVFYEILFSNGQLSMETIHKLITSRRVINALRNTFVMSSFTIVTVSAVGFIQIMLTEYFDIKGSRFLEAAFSTPLMYGGISLVSGYKYVYSSDGFVTHFLTMIFPTLDVNWFTGFTAILFVHTFSMTTCHILFVKPAFRRIDYSIIEASRNLGATSITAFFRTALPIVKPSIFSATILVTLTALNSFAAPSMLGGKNYYMVNSLIQNLLSIGSRDLAALLSFILAIACILLLLVFRHVEKRGSYVSISKVTTQMRKVKIRNPLLNAAAHVLGYALSAIYLLPVASILLFSFTDIRTIVAQSLPTALTIQNYTRVFSRSDVLKPFMNSVVMSLIAVSIVIILCVAASIAIHKKPGKASTILEMTLLIPWILPATMLVVGMISIYSTPNPLVLYAVLVGGFGILPVTYAVIHIPYAMRLIRASLYAVNAAHEEAARSLGANALSTFLRITLPAILPTVASVGAITFSGLISEYTVSALLYNVNNMPLGIVLRVSDTNTDPYTAANTLVYIVVLMAISAVTLLITRKSRENY